MAAGRIKKGSYKGMNVSAGLKLIMIPFGGIAVCVLLSCAGLDIRTDKIMPVLFAVFMGFGALVLLFPNFWRADSEGFTITASLIRWRFRYDDIAQIAVTERGASPLHVGGSARVDMTITCRSGRVVEFTEFVQAEYGTSPADASDRSSLMELCEYVRRNMSA